MSQRHPDQNDLLMFVTTNTLHRKPVFTDPACAREAVECLYRVQELHPFLLFAFVIMPDHCHFLLRVEAPMKISNLIGTYKSGLRFDLGIQERLWQPRFHLRVPNHAWRTLEYIHNNPVVAGLCEMPENYPWSSACRKWEVTPLDSWPS